MNWSPAAARTFFQCPRKWYYRELYSESRSADPLRTEAFFLSELSNVRAWRGKLVDQAVTRFAIPKINRREHFEEKDLLGYAHKIFQDQLEFGRAKNYRSGTDSEFRGRPEYSAFFELEYGMQLPEDTLKKCMDDIETSLKNLAGSELFKTLYEDGVYVVAQRTLKFDFYGVTVNSTPDLIVFSKATEPLVLDWKVERPMHKDHWLQLGMYGLALSRVNPHKDFPKEACRDLRDPRRTNLVEFQLLHNQVHNYKISDEDIVDLENYVHSSASQMSRFLGGGITAKLDPSSLPRTQYPQLCLSCNFKKICWKQPQ